MARVDMARNINNMPKFKSTQRSYGKDSCCGPSKGGRETYFPQIDFTEKELPEILDWKIGGEYEIVIKIKQTAIRKRRNDPATADFDVMGVMTNKDNSKHEGVKKMGNMLSKRQLKS